MRRACRGSAMSPAAHCKGSLSLPLADLPGPLHHACRFGRNSLRKWSSYPKLAGWLLPAGQPSPWLGPPAAHQLASWNGSRILHLVPRSRSEFGERHAKHQSWARLC